MRGAFCAILLAASLAACGGGKGAATTASSPVVLRVLPREAPSAGDGIPEARVEIAADPAARERGLMGRTSLPPDGGMLFVYPGEDERHFWMKDCHIPLAAAFMDGTGRILNIEEMTPGAGLPGEELRTWDSAGPARFVLEMEGGWFARRGIGAGDRVDLEGALRGLEVR